MQVSRRWRLALFKLAVRQRRTLRESEAAFIVLAALAGLSAGLITNLLQFLAHSLQRTFYGVGINRLSALGSIHHPWKLLALPAGGIALALLGLALKRRKRAPIDVVEANALHGGRIPLTDNLVIAGQTLISNGMGASVGLEAAYAQMGGGVGSLIGQWFKLRRADLRTLVGAGAGAAIGAAFGAPLTGAFYAFEIVIGTYAPAALAPVMAASLAAAFTTRSLGVEPYLIATAANRTITFADYGAYAGLGLVCAALGILIMRLVTRAEIVVQSWKALGRWRPVVGGALLMPIAFTSPQSLSSGHGALHLDLVLQPALTFLLIVLALKIMASVVSLSFGFRGGLFFASLFLGSLVGQIFAILVNMASPAFQLDVNDAALVGMAALSVSVVGGPMTLSILMLETTHDFGLMGLVLTATLLSSAITREFFGYSFSTWRLHMRGSSIRSPRDIGWTISLTAGRMMRKDFTRALEDETIGEFRTRVPLGSTSKVVLLDEAGRYCGIVPTASAYQPDRDVAAPLSTLATLKTTTLTPSSGASTILGLFDSETADEFAVVDHVGRAVGIVTEKHARRRYFEEMENSQRELFGES